MIDIAKELVMPKWEQAEFLFEYADKLPPKERYHWLSLANAIDHHNDGDYADNLLDAAMSHLAFRLRDEVVANQGDIVWHRATLKICGYMGKSSIWFKTYAQPIHWILASLKAKEQPNEE